MESPNAGMNMIDSRAKPTLIAAMAEEPSFFRLARMNVKAVRDATRSIAIVPAGTAMLRIRLAHSKAGTPKAFTAPIGVRPA